MSIEQLRSDFDREVGTASDSGALAQIKVKYLSRSGLIAQLTKTSNLGAMSPDERRAFGQAFNELKAHAESTLAAAIDALSTQAIETIDADLTVPATGAIEGTSTGPSHLGALHPITLVQTEVEDVFRSMGFDVYVGDEAVSEYENFDALNIPVDHPARDMQDTFWLTNGAKDASRLVLRTHTSAMQNRAMRELGPPLRAIFPGRCFRNEATDPTHENTFYQLEGMMVDRGITVANLIAVMKELLSRIFHQDAEVRLRPGYFPFVEPGFELDFRSDVAGGSPRWIELMPCGMIHPVVLQNGGIDPREFTGFAFGLGLTRLAMLKCHVPDVRLFNKGDLRFSEQFTATL